MPISIIRSPNRQRGAALVEWFVVALPLFMLLGLGSYQWIVIYEAKATLNHAAFMAARKGSLYNGDIRKIEGALAEYMAPLYAPDSGNTLDLATRTGVLPNGNCVSIPHIPGTDEVIRITCHDVTEHSRIRILNPTKEAFDDFAGDVVGLSTDAIPNVDLNHRNTQVGATSGVNIQDANLLKIEVVYGLRLNVPFVSWVFPVIMRRYAAIGSLEDILLSQNRIPIRTSTIVRMQTPAIDNSAVVTREVAEGIVDELEESSVAREDFPVRPWCGPTGSCDTEPVCNGCSCSI